MLYADIDVIQRMNVQILRWLGQVLRMYDGAPATEVYKCDVEENGNLTSDGKIRWQRTLSNLGLKIGEGA